MSSKRRSTLLDNERRPSLMEESFLEHLLQVAGMLYPNPVNPASFSFDHTIPCLHAPVDSCAPECGRGGEMMSPRDHSPRTEQNASYPSLPSAGSLPSAANSPSVVTVVLPSPCISPSHQTAPMPITTPVGLGFEPNNALSAFDCEYIMLYLSSAVSRSLNLEDYWSNLKSQIIVDQRVFFIAYCAYHKFSTLKALHLLEFLLRYEDLVAAGCNKEGERVSAAAQEATARAEAAAAKLAAEDPQEEEEAPNDTVSRDTSRSTTPAGGNQETDSARRKASKEKPKRVKPPSKKEKLALLAAEEQHRAEVAEAQRLAEEAAKQRRLAAERSKLSWEEILQHTMKTFLMEEYESGWRWDQFPWQPAPTTAAASGGAGGGGGGKKKGEKARLQQAQDQEAERRRLAAAAALPRENIYLKVEEIPLFSSVFLARGLLQHAFLYRYLQDPSHSAMEEVAEPIVIDMAFEVPLARVEPLWNARYIAPPPKEESTVGASTMRSTPSSMFFKPQGAGAANSTLPPAGAAGSGVHGGATPTVTILSLKPDETAGGSAATGEAKMRHLADEFFSERAAELESMEKAHSEKVELEVLKERLAEQERKMKVLFEDERKNLVIEDVYQSLEDTVTKRQLHILQRVEALEAALGIIRLPEESVDNVTPADKKGGKRKDGGGKKKGG